MEEWKVAGVSFDSEEEYKKGLQDERKIKTLKSRADLKNPKQAEKLYRLLLEKPQMFQTQVGEDFLSELLATSIETKKGEDIDEILEQKEEKKKRTIRDVLTVGNLINFFIILLLIAAAVCLSIYIINTIKGYKSKKELQEMTEIVGVTIEEGEIDLPGIFTSKDTNEADRPQMPEILEKYKNLYYINSDFVGWIKSENTVLNYPVMQNGTYYLYRNFKGEDDNYGLPFLDYRCDIKEPSMNYIIHGHNMRSGDMFAEILKYRNNSYYVKHKKIFFDTIFETGTYEVFAAFKVSVNKKSKEYFDYYDFIDTDSESEFNNFIYNIKQHDFYETNIWPSYGDRLLTLSTCEYSVEDGRFVVMARKIE